MSVEFPFTEVSDVDVAFPTLPNHDDVVKACPEEFWEPNRFSDLAEKWMFRGLDPAKDLAGLVLAAESKEDAIMQRKNVEAWLGSYRPAHQDKIAVAGWLLSLMFESETDTSPQ